VLANASVIVLEYVNRHGRFETFGSAILWTWPLILMGQWALFYTWRTAPGWLVAAAVFSFGTATMRTGVAWALGERVTVQAVLGVLVMLAGMLIVKGAPR